jgi:hypothetical protein
MKNVDSTSPTAVPASGVGGPFEGKRVNPIQVVFLEELRGIPTEAGIGTREATNVGDCINYLGEQFNAAIDEITKLNEQIRLLNAGIQSKDGTITKCKEVLAALKGKLDKLQGETELLMGK